MRHSLNKIESVKKSVFERQHTTVAASLHKRMIQMHVIAVATALTRRVKTGNVGKRGLYWDNRYLEGKVRVRGHRHGRECRNLALKV